MRNLVLSLFLIFSFAVQGFGIDDTASNFISLGEKYERGDGVEKDIKKAIEYYKKACEYKDGFGCYKLYVENIGNDSLSNLSELLIKSCEYNYAESCAKLATMYDHGYVFEKDIEKSNEYLIKACNLGESNSCVALSMNYVQGRGIEEDGNKSGELLQKSCDLDNAMGCYLLGKFSIPENKEDEKILYGYFKKSCDKLFGPGCFKLAQCYENEIGTKKDINKAKTLYRTSCNLGYQDACNALKNILNK